MIRKHLLLLSLAILIGIIFFTKPGEMNFVVLTVPFILIFLIVYNGVRILMKRFRRPEKERIRQLIAVVVAIAAVIALMLQSLGQLTVKDFLLLCALAIGIAWYLKAGSS